MADRLEELNKTFRFNDLTAIVTKDSRQHMLILCNIKDKNPVPVAKQPLDMTFADVCTVLEESVYNVGHALTTRQLDVDFDTANEAVIKAFDYFLPKTPYRIGRKSKPESHWIYNLVEDYYTVAPMFQHIVRFMKEGYFINGSRASIEYRYRSHKDNDFNARINAENPYVFAPGSIHPNGEMLTWQECFKKDITPVTYDARYIFKQTVLAILASLIVPYWEKGSRQYMSMALSGALHRIASVNGGALTDRDEPELRFTEHDFETLIKGICYLAGDDEVGARLASFKQSWRKSESQDKRVTGLTTLKRYLGEDAKYIEQTMFELITGIVSAINVQELSERYYIWVGTGCIVDAKKINSRNQFIMNRKQFTDSYAADFVTWRGEAVALPKFMWQSGVIEKIDGVDYFPPRLILPKDYEPEALPNFQDVDGGTYLNLYRQNVIKPSATPVTEQDIGKFLSYVSNVFGGTPEKMEYLMQWMANLIQSPGLKPKTYPIIVGRGGAGKSFLFEHFLRPILGYTNSVTSEDLESVLSNWNSILEGKILVVFEEAINRNRREVAAKLKQFVTNDKMVLKKKYAPEREVNNFCRPVFISNDEEQAVAIDAAIGERRASVIKVSDQYVGNLDYFADLKQWADDNLAKVHRYLLDYTQKPVILNTALQNDEKATMQIESLTYEVPEVFWILERIEEGFPLSTRTYDEWWKAYNSDNVQDYVENMRLDRATWPNLISEAALRADLQYWASRNGVPARRMVNIKQRLRNLFPYLHQNKRIAYDYMQDGKRQSIKVALSDFPTQKEILEHLRPKYGHIFNKDLELLALPEEDLTQEKRLERI